MIHHVLVPTDLSPLADRAVRYAADLAEALGADLELVHVCNAGRALYHLTWTPAGFSTEQEAAEATALARLETTAEALRSRGLPTSVSVVGPTEPAVAILDAAARADLVVLATHGASGEQGGLGPVASIVAHRAECPVLLVGPDQSAVGRGLRVLVPLDLSEASAAALRGARDLAAALDGAVEVVHAVSEGAGAVAWGGETVGADDEPPDARRHRYVERFVAESEGEAVPVRVRFVEGDPVEAVAQFAREGGHGLVAAGRPTDRPDAPDALLEAAALAAGCPTLRVPVR